MKRSTMLFAVLALVTADAVADDVRKHCIVDWTVQAPADASKISQGDLYDRVHYSTAATPATYLTCFDSTTDFTLPDGTACTADPVRVITDEDVNFPLLHQTKKVPFVRLTQPIYANASGTSYVRSQQITFTPVTTSVSNELTVVMRLRWNGAVAGKYRRHVFSYGWNWEAGKGVCCLIGDTGSVGSGFLGFFIGNAGAYPVPNNSEQSAIIYPNLWYDVAYTVRQYTEDSVLKTELGVAYCTPTMQNQQLMRFTRVVSGLPALSFTGGRNRISAQDSTALAAVGSDERHFRGDIQRITVYSKALDADEIRQAFIGESETLSLGVPNAKADEFSDAASETFDGDTMAWGQFRKTLTPNKTSVTISKTIDSRWANRPQVLRFGLLPDAQIPTERAYLKLTANGQYVGRVKVEPTGSNYCVCLPAKVMAGLNADNQWKLNLTLERDSICAYAGNVAFDYLTLGGCWQVGTIDNSNGEFSTASPEYIAYHVPTRDEKQCSAAVISDSGTGYVPQRFYFTLTGEEAQNLDLTFGYRTCSSEKWKLVVNGVDYDTRFWATNSWRYCDYEWTFPKSTTLKEGLNCISLEAPAPKHWVHHDALWLRTNEFYPGSLYKGPLGVGISLIVR